MEKKKEFKAESKRLLDLMINSIYTNKEIFLRELISNGSDAIDKLYYKSLTDKDIKINKDDLCIRIDIDKDDKKLIISDTGIGMSKEELEENLGTIAKSGSLDFKNAIDSKDIDIIGQFGVGFYSAFMVSKKVKVESKKVGEDKAYVWKSEGASGYTIKEGKREEYGTTITLKLKDDDDNFKYSDYLDSFKIKEIVKKYSDYIRYPIKMEIEKSKLKDGSDSEYETYKEEEIVNSMIPLWKKNKKDISEEEYNSFYTDKFFDYDKPLKTIHTSVEGQCSYNALLYIPGHLPMDFYTKEFEKGLALYSNGVLIMDKCADLIPDYFSFVKGLVDTEDVSLNISREMLQQDRQVRAIAKSIEKKIHNTLEEMMENNREDYEKFFDAFGMQLKYGVYSFYIMNNFALKDLLLFYSSKDKKRVSLKEYVERMAEGQEKIYYASGDNLDRIDMLPNVEKFKEKGYEVLYLVDYIDEFTVQALQEYDSKKFINVSSEDVSLDSEEEKKELETLNEESKDLFSLMKAALPEVKNIKFTNKLKNHPVCLSTEGNISLEMEKILNQMPTGDQVKAEVVLEINKDHPIVNKLKDLYENDKESLDTYTKILYNQARLIEGLPIENPTELTNMVCDLLSK